MRACATWDPALDQGPADFGYQALTTPPLRPLTRLGLMEMRLIGDEGEPTCKRGQQCRKAALFDQTKRFDVPIAKPAGPAH